MLRLVHPAPGGQGTDPPKRRKLSRSSALLFTPEEARHVRTFLRNTARAFGTWERFADALGVPVGTLNKAYNPKRRPGGTLVIRAARLAGVSVEAVLSGTIATADRCATCGHRAGDGRLVAAGGAP